MDTKEHKSGAKFYITLVFLLTVIALIAKVFFMLYTDQVSYGENEEAITGWFRILITCLFALPTSSYIISAVSMIKHLIRNGATAIKLTPNGVEDTLVGMVFLAFIFIVPVKLIPWEAVKYSSKTNDMPYIRVRRKMINAGFLARIIISIKGFSFCPLFAKPQVKYEELEPYEHRFNPIF